MGKGENFLPYGFHWPYAIKNILTINWKLSAIIANNNMWYTERKVFSICDYNYMVK